MGQVAKSNTAGKVEVDYFGYKTLLPKGWLRQTLPFRFQRNGIAQGEQALSILSN